MFDISWSELLILGVVTLIFVGPKELPVFLQHASASYVGHALKPAGVRIQASSSTARCAKRNSIKLRKEMMSMEVATNSKRSVRDGGTRRCRASSTP